MHGFSQFLIAFGVTCGIAAWFLFQKSLSKFVKHLQAEHYQTWQDLSHPDKESPPYNAITNPKLRQYILQKEYEGSSDFYVKSLGGLLRQRLLFSLFCLGCLIVGIFLMLIAFTVK